MEKYLNIYSCQLLFKGEVRVANYTVYPKFLQKKKYV